MRRLRAEIGQFIPISSMVMFTIVVIMLAVVNIYKVSKAKLKVQNLADAVALNVATQMASGINAVTDRNEWLNNLYGSAKSPSRTPGQCPQIDKEKELPGISCAEYAAYTGHFSFNSIEGAQGYAKLIKTINDAQKIFAQSYNAFIGASPGIGQRALDEVLKDNIPELRNDPTLRVIIWNSFRKESEAIGKAEKLAEQMQRADGGQNAPAISPHMEEMSFKPHDMFIAYDMDKPLGGKIKAPKEAQKYLREVINHPEPIGWMEIDAGKMPLMAVRGQGSQPRPRIGAGAVVVKKMDILGMPLAVTAKATAYLVPGSGKIPSNQGAPGGPSAARPDFKPTYWVKLGDQ